MMMMIIITIIVIIIYIASFSSYTCKSLETNLRDEARQHVMVECRPPVVSK